MMAVHVWCWPVLNGAVLAHNPEVAGSNPAPLPESAGQRPDCQTAIGPLIVCRLFVGGMEPRNPGAWSPERDSTLRGRLAWIGISAGRMTRLEPSRAASGSLGRVTLSATRREHSCWALNARKHA
jgi:hypothetical protein